MMIPTCTIKFIELVLTTTCLVLHQFSYDLTEVPTLMLCSGTYVGFVVVLTGEIVGEVATIGEIVYAPLDLIQDIYFGILGLGMFSICGGLILSNRLSESSLPKTGDQNMALICGALSMLTAVIFLFDLSLAYLDAEVLDEEGSEIVSAAPDAYVDGWWSASGSALFGACAWMTLRSWHDVPVCKRRTMAHYAAICAVVTALLFAVDALIALCTAHKDSDETTSRFKKPCTQC